MVAGFFSMASFRTGIQILCVLFAANMFFCFWDAYRLYYPSSCTSDQCVKNYVAKTPHPLLKLWVYTSTSPTPTGSDLYDVWELNDFKANENVTKDVTVRIPLGMHNNGTMFVHVFLAPAEEGKGVENPFDAAWMVNQTGELTTCHVDQATALQVTSDNPVEKKLEAADRMTCHWRSRLTLNVMTDDVAFNREALPIEIMDYIQVHEDQYLPVLLIDEVSYRSKDLQPLNNTCKEMPLTIYYTPVSHGRFRLWMEVKNSTSRENNAMTEKQKEDLKEVFINSLPRLTVTCILLAFRLLFELLGTEREVSFWQKRTTMGGLSTQSVIWGSVSWFVVFLYVMEEQKGLFNQIWIGFISIIKIWKVFRVFQARISWTEWRLVFDNDVDVGSKERETQALDSQAMRYLSWVLYPSWAAVIIYTLKYNFQKSWYSLCILSLCSGFSFFGYVFELPQLFINYKLKSVADLPWNAMMFWAAIATIDLICRFIVMMPIDENNRAWLHMVFFGIYLYQRWLYQA